MLQSAVVLQCLLSMAELRFVDLQPPMAVAHLRFMEAEHEDHRSVVVDGQDRDHRDVVFEEFGSLPTPVSQWLAGHGYQIFKLLKRWNGVKLEKPGGPTPFSPWEAPNYLATCDPERACARLAPAGWRCLA